VNVSPLDYPIFKMRIKFEPDIVTARQKTRRLAQLLGFAGQDCARLSTAVSELARNVFQYAGGGLVEFGYSDSSPKLFLIRVSDQGPGITNVASILNGTYSSPTGMGKGLAGSKKLTDVFDIQTEKGKGTVVTIGKELARHSTLTKDELSTIAHELSTTLADSAFEEIQNQNRDLLEALDDAKAARRELTELNEQLKVARDTAADANEAKSRFLSNMSHEIRTPLGVITGFTDLAMDPEATHDEQKKYLRTVKQNAVELTALIGEILDLSKVESGKIDLETIEFSLTDLMHDAVTALGLNAKSKGVGLTLKVNGLFPSVIAGDPTRIRQILINLINNALKFTDQGEVELAAAVERIAQDPDHLDITFTVRDTGIGISQRQQENLFEAFSQADSSTTRKYGGTGLGLHLSKQLALAMGGSLSLLSSRENVGSTFACHVKVETTPNTVFVAEPKRISQRDAKPLRNFENALKGMSVLLVEDSQDNQFLFSRYLTKAGALVDVASNGEEGFDKARVPKYDAILMDVQMPKLDGYGATSKIRSVGIQTPIIALTAHALKEDREKALSSGFSGYLIKPLNPDLLIDTLVSYFRKT